ncbi:MAG: polysaccharide biosynthesis protein [Acutalibacter sp.]|jgi:stage V sporulation protein B|uniref:putative polysaccharide biosynthesis protein n=1 Tax=unclassified Acutalibacter TaxID=2620728 RepID=UPI002172FED9|nr:MULTISPECIES: polysaccharide biosynthesis protein [unclassified Acutalibacter]MCI9224606.1 polysaccharide biosynthesis protein [Acutalibacter sp.]
MAEGRKNGFMRGTAILSASTLIVKALGLLFSIPLANFISAEGMSYFYGAYDIFTIFLVLSTAGLPIAVSRMVSTANAMGRRREADQVFSVAFWLFFAIGAAGCLIMLFGSRQISELLGKPGAAGTIVALAPTVFFLSITSALRGYFQGRSNMVPTAASQVIEAVMKVAVGTGLAYYIITYIGSDSMAAVGAIIGVSVSSGLGMIYLVFCKLRQRRKDRELPEDGSAVSSRRDMMFSLLRFAVPITLGACFLSVLDFVDSAVLMDRMKTAAGFTQDQADYFSGVLGNARKFFDLPGAFVVPISTSLLPVLSGAIVSGDKPQVRHISSMSMRMTLLIAIPASVGMSIFAEPICMLLLAGRPDVGEGAARLLQVLALAIAFSSTVYTTNAMLQSFGRTTRPVIDMAVGGVVKIALSYALAGIPEINVMGSAVSTVASYLVIVILNLIAVRESLPGMDSVLGMAMPLLFSAAVMGAASYGAYLGLIQFLSPRLALVPAIVIAVIVYALCAVLFRGVSYEDVCMLPKGETIARLLKVKKSSRPRHMMVKTTSTRPSKGGRHMRNI